ncbi:hypothetical protein XH92_20270 [Bradyrhizobium sp. CCBAU 53421]|nr:hypothetical protein XH92_20270 [Bradyrhizobium sp. CCBAU 53421]
MRASAERQEDEAARLDKINETFADAAREDAERESHADHAALDARLARIVQGTGVKRVNPHDKAAVAAAHAWISKRYEDVLEPRIQPSRAIGVIRLREFEAYLFHRYGRALPDDDAGRHDLTILLNCIALVGEVGSTFYRARASANIWAPRTDRRELAELIAFIMKRPRRYSAKKLGELTGLTEEEHTLLGITSFWPHTWNEADVRDGQKQRRKDNDRERKTTERRRNGVVDRTEWLAGNSKSRAEPWNALGMSRATYYRKLQGR